MPCAATTDYDFSLPVKPRWSRSFTVDLGEMEVHGCCVWLLL